MKTQIHESDADTIRILWVNGKSAVVQRTPEMPVTAMFAFERTDGTWKFTSDSRTLLDGLAVWTAAEMQEALK